ncbi:MAG: sensor histidine kinase [Armatimonadota bacterium]
MPDSSLKHDLKRAQKRLEELSRQATSAVVSPGILFEALEEFSSTLEELHVTLEELHANAEELAAAREAADAERRRYQELFEFSPDGYLVTDTAGNIREANLAAVALFDRRRELLIGYPVQSLAVPDDRQALRDVFVDLRYRRPIGSVEITMQGRRRATFVAALTVAPIVDAHQHLQGFRWCVRDISDQRRMEVVLREARDTLEQQVDARTADLARERAYLDTALDTLPQPVSFLAPDGRVVWNNRAAEVFLRERLGGRRGRYQLLDPATRVPLPEEAYPAQRALRGEVTANQEFLTLTRDGLETAVLVSAAPIRVEERIVAAVVTHQDISALKEYDRAKDEFLAILSHELQTPLTSILGWAQIALARDDQALLKQALEVVQRNALRQKRIIADLLDMSRLLHRKLDLEQETLDLTQLARHAVESLQVQAAERRIRLVFHPYRRALRVQGDAVRLQQCVDNLLQNSLKFTPEDGDIHVTCHRRNGHAELRVRDTGRGMAAEKIHAVFAPFRQIERDERAGGLGLGLAVTRGIIELHGGRITAMSPGPEQGSTFTISLPVDGEDEGVTR